MGLPWGDQAETDHFPNFHDNLNASYDLENHLINSSGATFVNFSGQYPADFDGDKIVEGGDLQKGGSGDALDISVVRMKSHTSKALNLRTDLDAEFAFAEFQFPSSDPAVHMTDVVFFMEAFNLYDSTKFVSEKEDIVIDFHFTDPFIPSTTSQVTRKLKIIDFVRNFRTASLGSKPVRALIETPIDAYPLRGADQPFMDLQTLRFEEAELKLRLTKIKISVPRFKTIVPLTGGSTATVNGGIRLHGIAITADFNFSSHSVDKPFDIAGPWYSQANLTFAPWHSDVINVDDPIAYSFAEKGCWLSSWASIMHAQGHTKVEEENTSALVNLTPLTLARYIRKLDLFEFCDDDPGTKICVPYKALPKLLEKSNKLAGNVDLAYNGNKIDIDVIEDHLARKIPVLLKIRGTNHFVVANGMETIKSPGKDKWVKTYFLNDVGYANVISLVPSELAIEDYGNKFAYALFMTPSDKNTVNSITIKIFSPARVFIVDPLGRRRGLNPADGISFDEIPGVTATLGADFHTTHPDILLPPDSDPMKYIYINDPAEGDFNLEVIGTGSGSYTMEVVKVDAFGSEKKEVFHGNTMEGQIDPVTIGYSSNEDDVTPPVTTSNFVEKPWNNVNPLIIQLTATDSGSGVAQTFAKVNGADAHETSSVTLAQEGDHTVEFWSVDRAGNVESIRTVVIHNDFTTPISSHDYTGTGTETGSVTVSFQTFDALSGPASFSLTVNGAPASTPLTLSAAGTYAIEYFSTDVAGNIEPTKHLLITINSLQTVDMHLKAKEKHGNDKPPQIELKWKHTGSGDYRVMRSVMDATQGFVEIGRTSDRKFDDGDVAVGLNYFYRIRVDNLQSEVDSVHVEVK